jgi:prevent-host-death family protein
MTARRKASTRRLPGVPLRDAYHLHDILDGRMEMPIIKPISDLRNKASEISRLCHESGEPVFITKDGQGDLVVMSVAAWEREHARLDLYRLLDDAEADVRAGDRGASVKTVRKRIAR